MPELNQANPQDFSNVVRGELRTDPANEVPVGASLQFEAGLITTTLDANASWVRDWRPFNGMLLSMHFQVEGKYSVDGSAVLVAPGVALCATHVIQPYRDAISSGVATCLCTGLASHGMQVWRLTSFTRVESTDITILGLQYASPLPPDLTFHQATVSTRLPAIGERLSLCGFLPKAFEWTANQGLACYGNVLLCRGEVTQQFPDGRDRHMLPWACLEVACPAWGGMSGGPVFDDGGHLIGLVCSSIASIAGEPDAGPAYVSLLWSAIGFPFCGGWPTGLLPTPASLLSMENLCSVKGRDALKVNVDQDGTFSWSVQHWS